MIREQRRFPRMRLMQMDEVPELRCKIEWPNFETSRVLDLSHKGLSAERPGLQNLKPHTNIKLLLELGADMIFPVLARLAWADEARAGFEILEVDARGRRTLSDFTEALSAGARMQPRAAGNSPEAWFGAGAGENVSVSFDGAQAIGRVRVEFASELVILERGQKLQSLDGSKVRAFLLLSQMDKPDLPMKDFLRALVAGD